LENYCNNCPPPPRKRIHNPFIFTFLLSFLLYVAIRSFQNQNICPLPAVSQSSYVFLRGEWVHRASFPVRTIRTWAGRCLGPGPQHPRPTEWRGGGLREGQLLVYSLK
jgi:hypothetical protein